MDPSWVMQIQEKRWGEKKKTAGVSQFITWRCGWWPFFTKNSGIKVTSTKMLQNLLLAGAYRDEQSWAKDGQFPY